jgi:hypothetical protein
MEKGKGLNEKWLEYSISNYFLIGNGMDSVHGSWTSAQVAGPWFHRGLHSGRRQGLTRARPSGRSGPWRLAVRRGKEGRCHGESNLANTEAWKAARGRLTSGGVSAQKGGGEGTVRAKRKSVGGVGVFTEGEAAIYRAEARRGRPVAFNGRR